MIFSKKRDFNEKDVKLAKSVLEVINTQKENVTVLKGRRVWYGYDKEYIINFAVMIKNTRFVFDIYRQNCFGFNKITYALEYNNQSIECDQYTLNEMFDKLLKMDTGSKESLYSLI